MKKEKIYHQYFYYHHQISSSSLILSYLDQGLYVRYCYHCKFSIWQSYCSLHRPAAPLQSDVWWSHLHCTGKLSSCPSSLSASPDIIRSCWLKDDWTSVRLTVTFLIVRERLINVYFFFGGYQPHPWPRATFVGLRFHHHSRRQTPLQAKGSSPPGETGFVHLILLTLKIYFECHSMEMPSVLLHSCIRLHEQKRGKPNSVRHPMPMFDPKKVLQSSNW